MILLDPVFSSTFAKWVFSVFHFLCLNRLDCLVKICLYSSCEYWNTSCARSATLKISSKYFLCIVLSVQSCAAMHNFGACLTHIFLCSAPPGLSLSIIPCVFLVKYAWAEGGAHLHIAHALRQPKKSIWGRPKDRSEADGHSHQLGGDFFLGGGNLKKKFVSQCFLVLTKLKLRKLKLRNLTLRKNIFLKEVIDQHSAGQ